MRLPMNDRTRACLIGVGACLLLACEPGDLSGPGADRGAPARSDADPRLVSLDDEAATQVYYQYVDDAGKVRFVATLAAVPEAWQGRVGIVEMASPPPLSPGDARKLRAAQMARMPSGRGPQASDAPMFGQRTEVILYSADWCGACRRAKQYLEAQGVDYDERNVDEPRWKEEMIAKAGPGGIPVFDIEGQILRGFSAKRLDQMLEQAS